MQHSFLCWYICCSHWRIRRRGTFAFLQALFWSLERAVAYHKHNLQQATWRVHYNMTAKCVQRKNDLRFKLNRHQTLKFTPCCSYVKKISLRYWAAKYAYLQIRIRKFGFVPNTTIPHHDAQQILTPSFVQTGVITSILNQQL